MSEWKIPGGKIVEVTEKGITHTVYEGDAYQPMKLKKKYVRGLRFKGVR